MTLCTFSDTFDAPRRRLPSSKLTPWWLECSRCKAKGCTHAEKSTYKSYMRQCKTKLCENYICKPTGKKAHRIVECPAEFHQLCGACEAGNKHQSMLAQCYVIGCPKAAKRTYKSTMQKCSCTKYFCSDHTKVLGRCSNCYISDKKLLGIMKGPIIIMRQLTKAEMSAAELHHLEICKGVLAQLRKREYEPVSHIDNGFSKIVFRVVKDGTEYAAKLSYDNDVWCGGPQRRVELHRKEIKTQKDLGDYALIATDFFEVNIGKTIVCVEIQEMVAVAWDEYDNARKQEDYTKLDELIEEMTALRDRIWDKGYHVKDFNYNNVARHKGQLKVIDCGDVIGEGGGRQKLIDIHGSYNNWHGKLPNKSFIPWYLK